MLASFLARGRNAKSALQRSSNLPTSYHLVVDYIQSIHSVVIANALLNQVIISRGLSYYLKSYSPKSLPYMTSLWIAGFCMVPIIYLRVLWSFQIQGPWAS